MNLFMETFSKRARMIRDWRRWVEEIARIIEDIAPDARIYVVGSIARGDYIASSDVDILVVSQNIPERVTERAGIKALVEERLGLPYYHPFEIHVLRPEEAEIFLRRAGGHVVRVR